MLFCLVMKAVSSSTPLLCRPREYSCQRKFSTYKVQTGFIDIVTGIGINFTTYYMYCMLYISDDQALGTVFTRSQGHCMRTSRTILALCFTSVIVILTTFKTHTSLRLTVWLLLPCKHNFLNMQMRLIWAQHTLDVSIQYDLIILQYC